ncbi:N-acetyltransferase domain-containing protein [Mycena indigotica]|uniref:N-alpha-acetyltransferase 40 n=1 Tax=Mycena indigotica TaxID=2126181 RepID=A0A8H6SYI6_9AGAR|nr:N-acetyltransferase domain-containing protein [Mycena indigotica]KAF7306986.1 N-acetyltransferase domain-containing protein [Mycena indigotica]
MSDIAFGSKHVAAANKAPASQIAKSIGTPAETTHGFVVKLADELDDTSRESIWAIFAANMRAMYTNSSFGWDPPAKKAELFDPLSRFLLVKTGAALVAFVTFRFEFEDGNDILYCYDLQVSEAARRRGLGRVLMEYLANIAKDMKMQKIMLTVFKGKHSNIAALRFYETAGFRMDWQSPNDEDEEDYKILSKRIQ